MPPSVCVKGVDFAYGSRSVFRHLDLRLRAGVTLLLGPNGAGKSTLLQLLVGGLRPAAGRVEVPTNSVGFMPQTVRAVPGMTVTDQVAYSGWLQGLDRRTAAVRAREALTRVRLDDLAERPASKLSGGQLRRVGLAQSIVHHPGLLVLDEPSASLDPEQRFHLRENLRELASATPLMVVSTHQVDDVSELYDQVVVLSEGHVRWQGGALEFLHQGDGVDAAHGTPGERAYLSILTRRQE